MRAQYKALFSGNGVILHFDMFQHTNHNGTSMCFFPLLLAATFRHTLQINDVARGLFLESTRSHKEEANWNKSKELSSFFFLSDVK